MKQILFIIFFTFNLCVLAQKPSDLSSLENELVAVTAQIKSAPSDSVKEALSQQMMTKLKDAYTSSAEAFNYKFPEVKNIGFIVSPDKKMKITNWNINKEDNTYEYFCLITRYDERLKKYLNYELVKTVNNSDPISEGYLNEDEWYGALYYDIIPTDKGNKTSYTILGYRAGTGGSQTKLIDVLSFIGRSRIRFGSPIFVNKKSVEKRAVYEYSKKSFMSLKFEPERGRIVMDHLSPETPSMVDFREFYVPDMSYDAYIYNDGKWDLKEDVVAINAEDDADKGTYEVYNLNKDGVMVSTTKKEKWLDPTNKNTPGTANIHSAAMPEENGTVKKAKKEKRSSKEKEYGSKSQKETLSPYQVIMKNKNKKNRH